MDFVTAFLSGSIKEHAIFVEQSLAYEVGINLVCSELFTRTAHRPNGRARLLDKISSVMGQAHPLDKKLSKRERGPSARQTISIWARTPI